MDVAYYFIIAFLLSFMGSLPFSLINLNVLSATIHRGSSYALRMAIGAALTEGVQLIIILYGYSLVDDYPVLTEVFRMIALPIFILMAVYFFLKPTKIQSVGPAKGRPFWKGIGFSMVNVLVYPFWLFWLIWSDLPMDNHKYCISFVLGAILGAFICLVGFIYLGKLIYKRSYFDVSYLNRLIAIIFVVLSVREGWFWFERIWGVS